MKPHPVILSIAGSDCSGGAGIQADIKTISALGGYAASAITAVTVQNTLGVRAIHAVPPDIVRGQIEAVMDDLHPAAVKIGMVGDLATARAIAECLRKYRPEHVVYDPVMISTSGSRLMEKEDIEAIKEELLPLATLLTPNAHEAIALTSVNQITDVWSMETAATTLMNQYHIAAVLVKGGHVENKNVEAGNLCDFLQLDKCSYLYLNKKIETTHLHGTGCTLSSAIATYLALGEELPVAIKKAEWYTHRAILAGKDLYVGQGNGPLWHFPEKEVEV